MDLSNNTILITGGSGGIGLAIAKEFLALGNTVIVTGRDPKKLSEAKSQNPKLHTIESDVADPKVIESLHTRLLKEYPDLNIIVNNAGIMRKLNLNDGKSDLVDLTREIETNLMGPIRMVKMFLPHLKTKENAAIVNVSSGLAFVPFAISPVYSATKAGLHAFSQSLRIQLKKTKVKVFELAPPGTDTPLFTGEFTKEESGGVKPMDVNVLAKHAIAGMKKDELEIRPGMSNLLKFMGRLAPDFAAQQLGKSAETMQ